MDVSGWRQVLQTILDGPVHAPTLGRFWVSLKAAHDGAEARVLGWNERQALRGDVAKMTVDETGVLRASGHAEDIDQVGIVLGNIHQGKGPFVLLAADQFRGGGTQRAKLNAIEPERGYSRAWPCVFVINGDGV